MLQREKIAIDLDDVISSQTDALIAWSNERFDTRLTRADFMLPGEYWGYYERIWNVGDEEGSRRFQQFLADKGPMLQVVEAEALTALQSLKRHRDLHIVTSRGGDLHQDTIEWLEKTVPDVFGGVHFVELWAPEGQNATKATVCMAIGANYLIDDNVDHCRVVQEAGVQGLLFGEYGWNAHLPTPSGVVRVKDWAAVLEYFDGLRG